MCVCVCVFVSVCLYVCSCVCVYPASLLQRSYVAISSQQNQSSMKIKDPGVHCVCHWILLNAYTQHMTTCIIIQVSLELITWL